MSLWWLPDGGHGQGSFSFGPGLPGPDHFTDLLLGQW
jgi:hypothetical protein